MMKIKSIKTLIIPTNFAFPTKHSYKLFFSFLPRFFLPFSKKRFGFYFRSGGLFEDVIFVFLLLGASSVSAEEKSADQWQYDFQVYMWGATFKNNLVNGDSVTITFSDMIKNLKLAGMVTFGARNDKFSMMTDVIHLRLEMQIKKR